MMTAIQKKEHISEEDYFSLCEESCERLELLDGQVYGMTGGTGSHNTIAGNIYGLLWNFLKGKECRPFIADMRVKVSSDTYFFPDVIVDCGYDPKTPLFAGNPLLIIEVLSPSTADYDRGEKFNRYKQIAGLEEYVLVYQERMAVDVYRRSDNWQAVSYGEGESVELQSIGFTVPIAEIYDRLFF